MSYVRFHAIKTFIRCYPLVRPRRRPVPQVHKRRDCFSPEAWWEVRLAQHGASAVGSHNDTDKSFGDSIR